MKKYDLLIVGNGFDLGSGYDTSYRSFLEDNDFPMPNNFLFKYCHFSYMRHYQSNMNWNGFEKLLCQFLQFINYLFKSDNVSRDFSTQVDNGPYKSWVYFTFTIKDNGIVPEEMIRNMYLANSFDKLFFSGIVSNESIQIMPEPIVFRYHANIPVTTGLKKDVFHKILTTINKELSVLEELLRQHIAKVTNERKSLPLALMDCHVDRILSFNYSFTAQNAFNLDDNDVAYVHGDIKNEIVLGIEPSMIDEQSFDENSDFIVFFKRFRRIYKNTNENYNEKILNKIDMNSIIGIYGHSLDLSDRSILKPLFEKECKEYDIYWFEDENDCKIQLSKLIGIDLYEKLRNDNKIRIINIKDH